MPCILIRFSKTSDHTCKISSAHHAKILFCVFGSCARAWQTTLARFHQPTTRSDRRARELSFESEIDKTTLVVFFCGKFSKPKTIVLIWRFSFRFPRKAMKPHWWKSYGFRKGFSFSSRFRRSVLALSDISINKMHFVIIIKSTAFYLCWDYKYPIIHYGIIHF